MLQESPEGLQWSGTTIVNSRISCVIVSVEDAVYPDGGAIVFVGGLTDAVACAAVIVDKEGVTSTRFNVSECMMMVISEA